MSNQVLVTRDSITKMLNNPNPNYVMDVVGRALVVIFNRQTEDEKNSDSTRKSNGIGFTGADARSGSLTAKSYLKNKKLQSWQVERWLKVSEKTGYARLCKYHTQLNEEAVKKQEKLKQLQK